MCAFAGLWAVYQSTNDRRARIRALLSGPQRETLTTGTNQPRSLPAQDVLPHSLSILRIQLRL